MSSGAKSVPGALSPDEAFAALANETRFAIVHALWEAHEPIRESGAVPFSDLCDRVDYGDSGNFSYHLDKLTDHFVRQTDRGYELTAVGHEVARTVVSGVFVDQPNYGPTRVDQPCPRCHNPLRVEYENQHVTASCTWCSGLWQDTDVREGADELEGYVFSLPIPPAGLADRTPEEALHATVEFNFSRTRSFIRGICPACAGGVEHVLHVCEVHEEHRRRGCPHCSRQHAVEVAAVCRRCQASTRGPLAVAVLALPTVTAFYHEQGVEHRFSSFTSYRLGQTVDVSVRSTDPHRLDVTIPCWDEELTLVVDDALTVLDSESTPMSDR